MSGEHLRDMLFPKHSFNVTTASENETVPAPGAPNYQKSDVWRQLITQLKDVPAPRTPEDIGKVLVFRPHKVETTDKDETEITYTVAWEEQVIEGTPPIIVTGEGSESDPYLVSLKLSLDSDNILKLDEDNPAGLFAGNSNLEFDDTKNELTFTDNLGQKFILELIDFVTEVPAVLGSDSVDVDSSDPSNLVVSVKISNEADNKLTIKSDGLYSEGGGGGGGGDGGRVDTVVGSTTIDVDATDPVNPVVSAKVSSEAGNKLTVKPDGLYSAGNGGGGGGDGGRVDSVVGSDSIEVDSTDEENPVVSVKVSEDEGNTIEVRVDGIFSEGGGGSDFEIMELPLSVSVADSDYLPIAQAPEVAAKYWRILIERNLNGSTTYSVNRLYELEFRDVKGVSRVFTDEVITGINISDVDNAIDKNLSSYASKVSSSSTYGLSAEYSGPFTLQEVAIYYEASNARNPGVFVIEYSDDNLAWQEWLSVSVTSNDITSGAWNTFSPDTTYTQRRVSISTLTDAIVGDIAAALDAINGEVIP